MRTPSTKTCDLYLDRLAHLHAKAGPDERVHIVALAARLQRERAECEARERVELDLVNRLNSKKELDIDPDY